MESLVLSKSWQVKILFMATKVQDKSQFICTISKMWQSDPKLKNVKIFSQKLFRVGWEKSRPATQKYFEKFCCMLSWFWSASSWWTKMNVSIWEVDVNCSTKYSTFLHFPKQNFTSLFLDFITLFFFICCPKARFGAYYNKVYFRNCKHYNMKKRYLFVQVEVAQVFQDFVEKSSGQPWDTLLLKKIL